MSSENTMDTVAAITVAIVDDEPIVRTSLEKLLGRSPGFACIGVYADAESAMTGLPANPPKVLLMDIQLPGLDGISAVRALRDLLPRTQIIMLTTSRDTELTLSAFAAGASGYLLKDNRPNAILESIKEVCAGGAPMSPSIARQVVKFFDSRNAGQPATAQPHVLKVEAHASLTERERGILNLMSGGLRYKEVAERIGLSSPTVLALVRNIYKKLGVRNQAEAMVKLAGAK
jgi:DNA-binding NarL/FixJ family response regulator